MASASESPGRLSAPHILEYPYRRSVGPVLGRFFTGLRDGEIWAGRSSDGRLIVPPPEYDPVTGEPLVQFQRVADAGSVVSWTWITAPKRAHPFQRPFAWALITLDGAASAFLHAIDAAGASRLRTGLRVRARWRRERVGDIHDIECFEPL